MSITTKYVDCKINEKNRTKIEVKQISSISDIKNLQYSKSDVVKWINCGIVIHEQLAARAKSK